MYNAISFLGAFTTLTLISPLIAYTVLIALLRLYGLHTIFGFNAINAIGARGTVIANSVSFVLSILRVALGINALNALITSTAFNKTHL